jgi:aspartate/methionine/tyrosine aminotransferase
LAKSYSGAQGQLIDLSQAVPGYQPHADLLRWLGEAAASPSTAGYGPIEGEKALRQAYADHVSAFYRADVSPGQTHMTAGCNQAFVAAIMAVAGPGDAVLMTNPCYFNHESTLAMLGINQKFVDCRAERDFLPDPAEVDLLLTPDIRAFVIVTPNNPTGATYPDALLRELFAVCAAKGVWLVIDETYRDFISPDMAAPHSLFAVPGWERTLIQLYSFSKSFCIPGHRLGAIIAGEDAVAQVAKVMDNLQICAPRPAQIAVARGLPALADWRVENAREIARRAAAFSRALGDANDWSIEAMGAYFVYLRHPFRGRTSREVAEALAREAGIISLPGAFFGKNQDAYLRIAFANAGMETIGLLGARLRVPLGL